MDHGRPIDNKTLNSFLSWQATAWAILLALCIGVIATGEVSQRTQTVLIVGVSISAIIGVGSSFWTGYTNWYKETHPRGLNHIMEQGSFYVNLGVGLFLYQFINAYFIEGRDIFRTLLFSLTFGIAVPGVVYFFMLRGKKR